MIIKLLALIAVTVFVQSGSAVETQLRPGMIHATLSQVQPPRLADDRYHPASPCYALTVGPGEKWVLRALVRTSGARLHAVQGARCDYGPELTEGLTSSRSDGVASVSLDLANPSGEQPQAWAIRVVGAPGTNPPPTRFALNATRLP